MVVGQWMLILPNWTAKDASCIISLTPSIKPSAENHGVFGEGESIRLLPVYNRECPSRKRPRPHARRDLHDFDFQPMPISSSVGAIWPRTIRERSSRRRHNYSGASRPTSHKLNDFTLSPAGCPTRLNAGTTAWPASISSQFSHTIECRATPPATLRLFRPPGRRLPGLHL